VKKTFIIIYAILLAGSLAYDAYKAIVKESKNTEVYGSKDQQIPMSPEDSMIVNFLNARSTNCQDKSHKDLFVNWQITSFLRHDGYWYIDLSKTTDNNDFVQIQYYYDGHAFFKLWAMELNGNAQSDELKLAFIKTLCRTTKPSNIEERGTSYL